VKSSGNSADGSRSAPPIGWGKERGVCVVLGQKVPKDRPRVRTTDDQEVRLGSYVMFHRGEPLTEPCGRS
jgi:hypothetical protein